MVYLSCVTQRPPDLEYTVDEIPPRVTLFFLGLQHAGIVATAFIFPILVAKAAGLDAGATTFLVSMTMLANGISTIFQAVRFRNFGSGFLIPRVAGPNFVSASILAVTAGGIPLLVGMTAVSGLFQAALSRIVNRLRVIFPVEVTGLVIMMLGVAVIPFGLPRFFGMAGPSSAPSGIETMISICILAITIGITVWGRGQLRFIPLIIGMGTGYVLCLATGLIGPTEISQVLQSPLIALPDFHYWGISFDAVLLIPFTIAAITTFVKSVGEFSICQRINDPSWKRPDMINIRSGLFADGIASFLGGVSGGMGQTGSSSNIGLSIATRATSRYIGYITGGILIGLAFLPMFATVFVIMPSPVIGATLLYVSGFIIVGGFQTITTRMLDSRKIFVVGLSFIFGISIYLLPGAYQDVPPLFKPIFDSALALTTVLAIILNLIMRIGISKTHTFTVDHTTPIFDTLHVTMERQGEAWAARKEEITRMTFALNEACEVLIVHGLATSPVSIKVRFDEFNLDSTLTYTGNPVPLPDTCPSQDEIVMLPDGLARLGGYMVRSHADTVTSTCTGDECVLFIHIVH